MPEVRAWLGLGHGPMPVRVELLREHSSKPAIHRIVFKAGSHPPVIAKHGFTAELAVERRIYRDILPHLPVSTPRCHGYIEDGDGRAWLFLEDVGAVRVSADDAEQRVLSARWLATLHRSAAEIPALSSLPESGPPRYLEHLRAGRDRIRSRLGNPALTAEDLVILRAALELVDTLESVWPAIERACADAPRTLVHGDFRPKNARVQVTESGMRLCVIDWEMSGAGVPAPDLVPVRRRGLTPLVDLDTYSTLMRERWPAFDPERVARLAIAALAFRAVASIDWDSVSLRYEAPEYLSHPVTSIRHYRGEIAEVLRAGASWLR